MTRARPTANRCRGGAALAALLLTQAVACASGQLSSLRFHNHAPIERVSDRLTVPKPIERASVTPSPLARTGSGLHWLALPGPQPARNVNALGEVPDSTWFENRIGVRDVSVAEIAAGPGSTEPDSAGVWTVVEQTDTVTLSAKDASGERYTLKLDSAGVPELETGADVVVSRLLWAAGYNVPHNTLVCLRRNQLQVQRGALISSSSSDKLTLLTEHDLNAMLARAPKAADGTCWRASASHELPGVPSGGFAAHGTRSDDPNDRVPHEHRRELRGLSVFFAWAGHTQMQETNTLDLWVEAPAGSQRGYLRHYIRDFRTAFGAWGLVPRHEHDGFTAHFDLGYGARSLVSAGAWKRPWEAIDAPQLPGVGRYEAARFDPAVYSSQESYEAFLYRDRFDVYWAATILARFTPEQIAAAVAQGKYSDPRTTKYLIATLRQRQQKLVRHAFTRVLPLDDFTLSPQRAGVRLCAIDLLLAYALGSPADTRYTLSAYDRGGHALVWQHEIAARADGVLCAPGLLPSPAADGYTMVSISAQRGDHTLPAVVVHLARDPRTRVTRIVGIERR